MKGWHQHSNEHSLARKGIKTKIPTKKKWIQSDGWRGYYAFDNSAYSTWATGEYADAGENAGSKVKERLKEIRKLLKENGIDSKIKTSQTSNVFSTGVDILVAPSQVAKAKGIIEKAGID